MSHSSILGGESAATSSAGKDAGSLGPSDSSDSGSDIQGERPMPTLPDGPDEQGAMPVDLDSDSDALGTGERGAAYGRDGVEGADILPDRIVTSPDAVSGPDGDPVRKDVERIEEEPVDEEGLPEDGSEPADPADRDPGASIERVQGGEQVRS
jgi:hypothetical protein